MLRERARAVVVRGRITLARASMHVARVIRHAAAPWHANNMLRCMSVVGLGAGGAVRGALRMQVPA